MRGPSPHRGQFDEIKGNLIDKLQAELARLNEESAACARARAALSLAEQVDRLTAAPAPAANGPGRLPGDARALRGLPALGKGIPGGAIAGTVPGSDEHLETLEAASRTRPG